MQQCHEKNESYEDSIPRDPADFLRRVPLLVSDIL